MIKYKKGSVILDNNYYIMQRDKLSKSTEKFVNLITPELIKMFGKNETNKIKDDIKVEYDSLIPDIPYIGGKKNNLTSSLITASSSLALYNVLTRYNTELYDIGRLIYLSFTRSFNKTPYCLRKLMGKRMFSKSKFRDMQKRANYSQLKIYPYDWVWEINKGYGINYDLAIDYTECGIVKYFHEYNADELTPYICNLDYVIFKGLGIELNRTKTLGCGCDSCNFRFIKNGNPREPWPPFFQNPDIEKEEYSCKNRILTKQ